MTNKFLEKLYEISSEFKNLRKECITEKVM